METEQKNRPRPPSDSPGTEPVSEVRLPRRELHLDSGMSFCEAGREVIGFHFYRVLANEPGTVRGDDPEPDQVAREPRERSVDHVEVHRGRVAKPGRMGEQVSGGDGVGVGQRS